MRKIDRALVLQRRAAERARARGLDEVEAREQAISMVCASFDIERGMLVAAMVAAESKPLELRRMQSSTEPREASCVDVDDDDEDPRNDPRFKRKRATT